MSNLDTVWVPTEPWAPSELWNAQPAPVTTTAPARRTHIVHAEARTKKVTR